MGNDLQYIIFINVLGILMILTIIVIGVVVFLLTQVLRENKNRKLLLRISKEKMALCINEWATNVRLNLS
jgi:hypothetical protein